MQGTWALTVRSLRQDSRLLRYHLLRFGVAGLLVLTVYVMWESELRGESPGRDLLTAMAYANLFAVTIVGVLLFAPTITEEKEEQTLGLLRMTHIGPSALLLGKALPKLVLISLVLIVQLPLVFLTRTLGGVDWPQIANVYLLIFCQLIGVVSLSMVSSVVMRTSTGAVVLAATLVCFWALGIPGLHQEVHGMAQRGEPLALALRPFVDLLILLSPIPHLDAVLQTGSNVGGAFQTCFAVLCMVGIAYLFSVWSFSFWNTEESTQTELGWLHDKWLRAWHRITHPWSRRATSPVPSMSASGNQADGISETLPPSPVKFPGAKSRYSHPSWQHAIAWKDFFLLGGGRTGFRVRCFLALFGSLTLMLMATDLAYRYIGTGWSNDVWLRRSGEPIIVVSFYLFCLDLIYLSVNLFAYELRHQTWESLMLLPMSLGTICRQKIWGACVHLIPWITMFLCGLFLVTNFDDIKSLISSILESPLTAALVVLHVVTQFVTVLLVLTALSLRLNPWVSILLTWFIYWGAAIVFMITLFIVFGFMSGPGPLALQALFHMGWIGGTSVVALILLRAIRSRLQGEAPSV